MKSKLLSLLITVTLVIVMIIMPGISVYADDTSVSGWLDAVSDSEISGWAWDSSTPNTPICVHVYILDKATNSYVRGVEVDANRYRSDLENAGYGNGCHGFVYYIDWNDFPGGDYEVHVFGIDEKVNPMLSGCPIKYNVPGNDYHSLGYSSVLGGTTVYYTGSGKYSNSFNSAISMWNTLGSDVKFEKYSSGFNHLKIWDVSYSDVTWCGLWTYYPLVTNTIQYNNFYLDQPNYYLNTIKGVYAHELGHALGIGDHYSKYYKGTIMYGYASRDVSDSLTSHDIEDFHKIWDVIN